MKTTIKFRDAVEVLTDGSCYVCMADRNDCREDYLCSREMMAAAVSALGAYDVVGITTTDDEPCFTLRCPWDARKAEGDSQK